MNKIDGLLIHLKESVKFYSSVNAKDFEKIPLVNKQIIKSNYDLFLSQNIEKRDEVLHALKENIIIENYVIEKSIYNKYILEWTSGTSGVPFKCVKSINERKMIALLLWKRRMAYDKTISAKKFYPFIHTGMRGGKYDIRNYDKENIRRLYEEIEQKKTVCIHATPNLLKRHIQRSGLPIDFFRNKVPYIELTGHYLSDEDKKMFEDVFGATILNMYGLIEIWGIGYSCKCGNMHILEDNVFVEIIKENGEKANRRNEPGEIVVTALNQYVMPFVRYKTGDYGYISEEKCPCGCKNKVLVLIPERKVNYLYRDGKYEDGTQCTKQIMRKIYWQHDFDEVMYIFLAQRGKSNIFKIVLNDIKEKELFEKIALDIFYQIIKDGSLSFEYVDEKLYDQMNPKGYIFVNNEQIFIKLKYIKDTDSSDGSIDINRIQKTHPKP